MFVLKWVYQFRGYLVAPPIIIALFCYHLETESHFVWPFGIALFLIGVALRVWAQQHLHYRLKVHKTLTITGPYLFVRNPIYLGNIFIFVGASILSELLWLTPVTLFYSLLVYSLVVRYEEAHLLNKYGEPYHEYMRKVPRWFPRSPYFKKLDLINEYLFQSVVAESHCFLLLLLCVLKEMAD